jgi:hypothetical protein
MSKKSLILILVLYIASTAISYGAFSLMNKKGGTTAGNTQDNGKTDATQTADSESALSKLINVDPKAPRDQSCPLNGKLYTQAEADAWGKRRPLAVMIENTPDARPQSGLTSSDLVFEAVAEYGITRFMGMYYCDVQVADTTLAPIRSAREYFFQLASGFNRPLYVHVGGANLPGPADALGHISDAGWNGQNDMNQFSIGYPTFVRDYNRVEGKDLATEHTMVTSTEKLWAVAAKRGWTNFAPIAKVTSTKKNAPAPVAKDWKDGYTPWLFQDGTAGAGNVHTISYMFWSGLDDYSVKWEYDAASNSYKRILAGQPHVDSNNDQQVMSKNVVVMFTEEKGPIDDKKHMLYTVTGTGDAIVFQNGQAIKAKWSKKDRESELFFTDEKGKPIQFVRGQIWISIVGLKTAVTY